MKYGLIGEKLGHSFSKEIHEALTDYVYELVELDRDEVESFIQAREFAAINVTIPYKEAVIPYLDEIDEVAKEIGAVNCVVNRGGGLFGYNTDFFGMTRLIERLGVGLSGKTVAILGTGGTSKTARAVARSMGAGKIIVVSRTPKVGEIDYDTLYSLGESVEFIINTTPVGMYPKVDYAPIEVEKFPRLEGLVDAIYNPARTRLVSEAVAHGIPAMGGLYMLVAQAVAAIEIFKDTRLDASECERVYGKIASEKENIVLIGMPSSGKTTVGKYLAEALGRELVDTDEIAVRLAGMPIPEIFEKYGEAKFREIEAEAVAEAAKMSGVIIATGGGAVLRPLNVERLKRNGRLFFLDRSLELLIPTEDRPLSSTRRAVEERYRERYPIYNTVADEIVDGDGAALEVGERIIELIK